ncbi:MAG: hypothetical protein AAGB93_18495 [Planctomycetota bacterium]
MTIRRTSILRPLAAVPLAALALAASCQSAPEPMKSAEISNEVTASARVVAIDPATREITIEREDGSQVEMVAGPEVRNFDQIEVGSVVEASYVETIAARLLEEGEAGEEPAAGVAAGRAAEGEAPGVGLAVGVTMTVEVQSVDKDQHLVVFTDPDGILHAVRAEREIGQQFVQGLKQGDRVELTITEALALTVE